MRKPETIERLYLDFDGFFASVEQQANPRLRGRPIGVVPFAGTGRTVIIACSKEAKLAGIKNVMSVADARAICPDLVLVPQSPDLYRRAHNTLLCEIESVIPIDAVKSIDELTCRLDCVDRLDPEALADRIKRRIAQNVGFCITCSIGFAANRQLAKIASKLGKPNGVVIWQPNDLPAPLFRIPLESIPGVGRNMHRRLFNANIVTTEDLYRRQAKELRAIWNSVSGERLWYALHGYDVQAPEADRKMFGHGRVLPPESRSLVAAKEISRLLMTKAARRLRRAGYCAGGLWLWLAVRNHTWQRFLKLPAINDDQAILSGLNRVWVMAESELPHNSTVFRCGVTLCDLARSNERQTDIFLDDRVDRQKWERVTAATDVLNGRYGKTVVSIGPWCPPAGGHVGGKISFTRIPSAEDFW